MGYICKRSKGIYDAKGEGEDISNEKGWMIAMQCADHNDDKMNE